MRRSSTPSRSHFPNVFVGCSWGVCSERSGLPRRVSRVRSLLTSWSIQGHAKGVWAASYDIWFDRTRHTGGQARGAEIMIWLKSRGFGRNRWPVVTVRHVRYHLAHWVTSHKGTRWNYIQFNRVEPTAQVRDLEVQRFISVAEERGLVSRRWWLVFLDAAQCRDSSRVTMLARRSLSRIESECLSSKSVCATCRVSINRLCSPVPAG